MAPPGATVVPGAAMPGLYFFHICGILMVLIVFN